MLMIYVLLIQKIMMVSRMKMDALILIMIMTKFRMKEISVQMMQRIKMDFKTMMDVLI